MKGSNSKGLKGLNFTQTIVSRDDLDDLMSKQKEVVKSSSGWELCDKVTDSYKQKGSYYAYSKSSSLALSLFSVPV